MREIQQYLGPSAKNITKGIEKVKDRTQWKAFQLEFIKLKFELAEKFFNEKLPEKEVVNAMQDRFKDLATRVLNSLPQSDATEVMEIPVDQTELLSQ